MDIHMLARDVAAIMREHGIKKRIPAAKHTLHVTDDEGNRADFVIKRVDTPVAYSIEDVETILKNCIVAIETALQLGENISIRGFGKLEVKYREARRTKDIETGEWIDIEGRYVPKFTYGNELRTVARLYENSLMEGIIPTRIDREGVIEDEEYDDTDV